MLAWKQELHHLAAKHSARDRAFLEIAHSVTQFLLQSNPRHMRKPVLIPHKALLYL